MRVIITRPLREATKWAAALSETGYDAVALPLVEVAPAADLQSVEAAFDKLADYQAAMFVSGNAVDHFFAANRVQTETFCAGATGKTIAFATGPGTVAALLRAGAEPEFIEAPDQDSQQFDSEALWAVMGQRIKPGYRVLIVRGAGAADNGQDDGGSSAVVQSGNPKGNGRDWFAKQVRASGGLVEYVVAYQRVAVRLQGADLVMAQKAAADGSVWMFSSSEAIDNLLASCSGQTWNSAKAVVTHPRIGEAARKAGFGTVLESRPSLASMLASIESLQ